jgi:very-short-patch-repair endonuclease
MGGGQEGGGTGYRTAGTRYDTVFMSSSLTDKARILRIRMTDAERRLWRELRQLSLGCTFRRQAPIGPYIVDFVCFERKIVIEVDGGQHLGSEGDAIRDRDFKKSAGGNPATKKDWQLAVDRVMVIKGETLGEQPCYTED